MALDNFKNNVKVTVSLGYDAAAVSIVLQSGDAAKLPTAPFNAEWWDSTTYTDPTDDPNKEIIRVTTVTSSNDTLTIVRAQESTSASTKNTASKVYKLLAGLTAKTLNTDIPATYTAYNATMTTSGGIPYVTGAGTITEDDSNFHWDSSGHQLGIGTNAPAAIIHITASASTAPGVLSDSYATQSQFSFRRANGSAGGPTALLSGDLITRIGAGGYTGSAFTPARRAVIEMNAAENWGTASNGAYISIQTTPKGSTTIAEVVRITDAGFVGIGTATPGGQVHIIGNNPTLIVDGTANPSIRFQSSGTNVGVIGIPTAAGGFCSDSGINDLVIRSANNWFESVDGGTSARRMIRPFKSLTNNTATTVFSLAVANNTGIVVKFDVVTEALNGTDVQIAKQQYVVYAINKATVVTATLLTNLSENLNTASTGSLSVTTTVSNANPIVVQINANSSLASLTAGYPRVTITIENFTRQTIGPA